MLRDAFTVKLRLPGLVVAKRARIEIAAKYAADEVECPRCLRPTWQVHQWSRQRKRDLELWGKQVWLYLWKRRFRCRRCRYVYTEDNPAWAAAGARRTG